MKHRIGIRLIPLVLLAVVLCAQTSHAQADPPVDSPAGSGQGTLYLPVMINGNPAASNPDNSPPAYRRLSDLMDFISVEAPAAWNDIEAGNWPRDGAAQGVFVMAAPDLEAFEAGSGPGVLYVAMPNASSVRPSELDPASSIRAALADGAVQSSAGFAAAEPSAAAGCAGQTSDYADAFFTGLLTRSSACAAAAGQQGTVDQGTVDLDAMPLTGQYVVHLRIATGGADGQAIVQHVLDTFQVVQPSLIDPHHAAEDAEDADHQH